MQPFTDFTFTIAQSEIVNIFSLTDRANIKSATSVDDYLKCKESTYLYEYSQYRGLRSLN